MRATSSSDYKQFAAVQLAKCAAESGY